jgi:SAM-dependent methyltransferase
VTDCREKTYRNAGNTPLLDLLPDKPGRALDCGCGAGDNAKILKERGWSVTGITVSPEEQRAASAYCREVFLADLNEGFPEKAGTGFDLILFSHVLEHLITPVKLLGEAKRLLVPDGLVAVALPNILFYPYRVSFLCGNFEYEAAGALDETHLHFYTFTTGSRLIESAGYGMEASIADGVFPLWKLRNLLPASFVGRLNRFAAGRWPDLFGCQSLYIARVNR